MGKRHCCWLISEWYSRKILDTLYNCVAILGITYLSDPSISIFKKSMLSNSDKIDDAFLHSISILSSPLFATLPEVDPVWKKFNFPSLSDTALLNKCIWLFPNRSTFFFKYLKISGSASYAYISAEG